MRCNNSFSAMLFILALLGSIGSAMAGTVDNATLSPESATITLGESQQIVFSAVNDKAYALKDFSVDLRVDAGMNVSLDWVDPPSTSQAVNPKQHSVTIKWTNIEPNTELQAYLSVSAPAGEYNIRSYSILYHDFNQRKGYAGVCNPARIIVERDTIPPDAPRDVYSTFNNNSIQVSWSQAPAVDIAEYRLYKRTAATGYTGTYTSVPGNLLSYTDTAVQAGTGYFYTVKAMDLSGNESLYSIETGDMFFNTLIKSYGGGGTIAAVGDVNGDGKPDVAMSAYSAKRNSSAAVAIFLGGGSTTIPSITLNNENAGDYFGHSLALVDLNQDGYDDLVVGAPMYDAQKSWPISGTADDAGKIYCYAGGPQFSTTPVFTVEGDYAYNCSGDGIYLLSEQIGTNIAPAGDVNGDGYPDVVVGNPMAGKARSGSIIILLGSPSYSGGMIKLINPICDFMEINMGTSVAAAGDVNGDGYDDVLAGAKSKAYLIYGGSSPYLSDVVFSGNNPGRPGETDNFLFSKINKSVTGCDFNGDGFSDAVISAETSASVYYGGAVFDTQPDLIITNTGGSVVSLGDINQDGFEDLYTGNSLLLGNDQNEIRTDVSIAIPFIGSGDVDGDGRRDLIASGPQVHSLAAYASLPLITITSPASSLTNYHTIGITGSINGVIDRLFVAGRESQLLADQTFAGQKTLELGTNFIEVIGVTPANEIAKRQIRMEYKSADSLGLVYHMPADGETIHASPLHVTGTANNPLAAVTVNSVAAAVAGYAFQADIELVPGFNAITVEATDVFDQTLTHGVSVTYIPPLNLHIAFPAEGQVVNDPVITVTGSVTNNADVLVNGIQAVVQNNTFTAEVALTEGPNTITATATDSYGQTADQTIQVTYVFPLPVISLFRAEPYSINLGESTTLSWEVLHADTVFIDNGVGVQPVNGSVEIWPEAPTTYTLTATGPGGLSTKTYTVRFKPRFLSITMSPPYVVPDETSILTWDTEYADRIYLQCALGWSTLESADGSREVVAVPKPGGVDIYEIWFNLTAYGPGGTSETIAIAQYIMDNPYAWIDVFEAAPAIIHAGESAVLSWTTGNAIAVEIDNGIGPVPVNGSVSVAPVKTTTYTLTAKGATGPWSTRTATVTAADPPEVSLTVSPLSIEAGGTAVLSWTSLRADTVAIDNNIGNVAPEGSLTVSPAATTTYTITASNAYGATTSSSTIIVQPAPIPTVAISATPDSITTGQTAVLTWSSTHAETCRIEPGIGDVPVNGTLTVTPEKMTLYTIIAEGPNGTAKAYARVLVQNDLRYDYGDPTPAEQAHLEAINRARLAPAAEATRLGIDLNEGLPAGTISIAPAQPLAFNARLIQAAYLHSKDMLDNQYFGHYSQDGRWPEDRLNQAGYLVTFIGENIANQPSNIPMDEAIAALAMHDALFIDAGVEGRGHRLNILNNDFKEIGVGQNPGPFGQYPYSWMATCDFASSAQELNSFVLGVVYADANSDGLYTAGEGLGNIEIRIPGSDIQTRTASAGGYGIPSLPSGTYTLRAELADGRFASKQFSIADKNVKIDFLVSEFVYPIPTITAPGFITIHAGETAIIEYNTYHADSVTISGIGAVPVNGAVNVSPPATATYTITAVGPGGTNALDVVVAVTPIDLALTPFPDGWTVNDTDALVQGTFTNPTGNETGIMINGVSALVYGNQFVANNIALTLGGNVISVRVVDSAGNIFGTDQIVTSEPGTDYIRVQAGPEAGLSPLETTLQLNGSFTFTASTLTCSDTSAMTILESAPDSHRIRLTGEGLYFITAEATDGNGTVFTDTVCILLYNRNQLDTLLKTKWSGMKNALIAEDMETALKDFTSNTKERYQRIFTGLSGHISPIASGMQEIEMIYAKNRYAKYRIVKQQTIEGVSRAITYYVYFIKDNTGLWHIEKF